MAQTTESRVGAAWGVAAVVVTKVEVVGEGGEVVAATEDTRAEKGSEV